VLFIDARKLGTMVDRTRREFSAEDIAKITGAYHAWRCKPEALAANGLTPYEDVPGFCASVSHADIAKQGHVLTPGRYVGAEDIEDDGIPFAEKFAERRTTLAEQFAEGRKLEAQIEAALAGVREGG
ncbi:MAG TPA: DNA methyltransferase, partial [Hyphomonas sp.]|nr:DNA methyltransferase [Hyphomonas sp.]